MDISFGGVLEFINQQMLGSVEPKRKIVTHKSRSVTGCYSIKGQKSFPHIGKKYYPFFILNRPGCIKINFADKCNGQLPEKGLVQRQLFSDPAVFFENLIKISIGAFLPRNLLTQACVTSQISIFCNCFGNKAFVIMEGINDPAVDAGRHHCRQFIGLIAKSIEFIPQDAVLFHQDTKVFNPVRIREAAFDNLIIRKRFPQIVRVRSQYACSNDQLIPHAATHQTVAKKAFYFTG